MDEFDRAASAFPDISLDGELSSFQTAASTDQPLTLGGGFVFDDFGSPPHVPTMGFTDVKVTGDEDMERFEDQFPELDVGKVKTWLPLCLSLSPRSDPMACLQTFSSPPPPPPVAAAMTGALPTFGAAPPFAPRPQPSALSQTPILNQQLDDDEPEAIRCGFYPVTHPSVPAEPSPCDRRAWREAQTDEIRARDEASKAKRQDTISKAERAIDLFYEEYATRKERAIRENKSVVFGLSRL